jgi:hypothetical protein
VRVPHELVEQVLGVGGEHVELAQGHAGTGAAVRGEQALNVGPLFRLEPLGLRPRAPAARYIKVLDRLGTDHRRTPAHVQSQLVILWSCRKMQEGKGTCYSY